MKQARFASLLPSNYFRRTIQAYLDEDLPSFDVGGHVVGRQETMATLYVKSSGVLAGVPFFVEVFRALNCHVEWSDEAADGVALSLAPGQPKMAIATVKGVACDLLQGERVALNLLARCSGVATRAAAAAAAAEAARWHGRVAATRKTTPGFRIVEKYGVLVGGCDIHRMDLSSMVMLKDNHINAHGSITRAVAAAREACGFAMKIEVECGSLAAAREAVEAGADVVMLDNFSGEECRRVAAVLRAAYGDATRFIIEASGGVTVETLANYACDAIDVISMGSLTQGYDFVDFSLKIE